MTIKKVQRWNRDAYAEAKLKQKGKKRCEVCGLYLCVCQSILPDYGIREVRKHG